MNYWNILVFMLASFLIQTVYAEDSYMYVCKTKNGSVNFTDRPCTSKSSLNRHEKIKILTKVQSVDPKIIANKGTPNYQVIYTGNEHCQRINILDINKKYDTMVFDARFKYQRDREKPLLQAELAHIEMLRRSELQGCS